MKEEKKLDLTNFDELDQNIIQMVLSEPCITNTEIGERLGKTRQTISTHRNSEAVQAVLNEVRDNDIERFMELRKQALERSALLMQSDNEQVAASICKEYIKSIVPQQIDINTPGTINISIQGVKPENPST
jgi:IS30 family transposase